MIGPVFVDTNVVFYAWDPREPLKQPLAREVLDLLCERREARTSVQVVTEVYACLTEKAPPSMTRDRAWSVVEALLAWQPQVLDPDVIQRAHDIEQRHRISWWDSLIVAAAQCQRCATLLTEDLQHRGVYGGVTVLNPFKAGVSESAVSSAPRRKRPTRSAA